MNSNCGGFILKQLNCSVVVLLLILLLLLFISTSSSAFQVPASSKSPVAFVSLSSSLSSSSSINMASAATKLGTQLRAGVGKLRPETTAILLIDVQERFRPLIWRSETVINTCRYMTSVAKALDIPVLVSQQYTKVFGETVPDCFASPDDMKSVGPVYEKKLFSMCTDQVRNRMDEIGNKDSYIVLGIEAHVCVQQTCLDLLEQGKDVHLIVDGVSSQQPYDREIALYRLQHAGAFLTTAQSAAFMLMRSAEHPNFKTVSKLTVEHMKLPNEFNDAMLK